MNETIEQQILEAGNAQSPEPEVTTPAPQPSESANPAVAQEQPQQQEDLPTLIAQAYAEDPIGTLQVLAQHAGYQLVPAQPSESQNPALPGQQPMDPWQQLILSIALNMWQGEASKQVQQLAEQDGIELSDQDLQQIFLDALEKYQGDVEVAYSKFALPRIRSKQNQPRKEQEKEPEATDIDSAILLAGYR